MAKSAAIEVGPQDVMCMITRRNAKVIEERKVIDNQYVNVERVYPEFYGPFDSVEAAESYLATKRSRRNADEWADHRVEIQSVPEARREKMRAEVQDLNDF